MQTEEKAKKKLVGRPALPKGEAKRILAAFKLSKIEDKQIRSASKRAGKDKSSWMRETLLKAACAV